MSQQAVASKLGIAKTTVINWEKFDGRWQPDWEQLEKICSWTGIKPLYFFIEEDFGSDFFDLAERIKALDPELRASIEGIIAFAERERLNHVSQGIQSSQ